jgi:tight adherence protein C
VTHDQLLVLSIIGGGILALVAAAFLLLFQGVSENEMARRISGLRTGAVIERPRSVQIAPALVALMHHLGNAIRDRMLSVRDAEALGKTLAAAGLDPSKAMPIFIGAKITCLFSLPALVWLSAVLLGYPTGKQALFTGLSLGIGMMLPNWVVALIRRTYQNALRRGIPDALDLLVVCAEAGLGLESAVERVAQEMKLSNRPVSVEFSLLMHEMRVMPDRNIALNNLAERAGQPAFRRLAGAVIQTMKYGTPLSQGLRTLAADLRDERMIQFEERAGRLPALLVLPMMLFILPCLFIIILGMPAAQLMGVFASMHH